MQMLNHLQDVVQSIKEIQIIAKVDDEENTLITLSTNNLYNNQFLATCTVEGIKRYEDMFGISYLAIDTLEERIFRLIAYYNKQLPYTKPMLEQNLEAFCGKDGYKIVYDYEIDKLTVKIALSAQSMFNTVRDYLETTVPLNIIIDCMLLYNTWNMAKMLTWDTVSTMTWKQLREGDIANVNDY
ncbi:putative phage tail protein [Anaerosporobacter sp.]